MEAGIILFGFGTLSGLVTFSALSSLIRLGPHLARMLSIVINHIMREIRKLPIWVILILSLALTFTIAAALIEIVLSLSGAFTVIFFPHSKEPWDKTYLLYA